PPHRYPGSSCRAARRRCRHPAPIDPGLRSQAIGMQTFSAVGAVARRLQTGVRIHRAERLPVSRVASQANAVHSPYHGAGAHRPTAADAKQPSSPFAELLDTAAPTEPQGTADPTNDGKGDLRLRRSDGRDRGTDRGTDRAPAESDKPAADANAATANAA